MNYAAIAAFGSLGGILVTVIVAAFIHGKLAQKVSDHTDTLADHSRKLEDHSTRITRLEEWKSSR